MIEAKYFENLGLVLSSACSDRCFKIRASKSDLLPSMSMFRSAARACSSGFFFDLRVFDILRMDGMETADCEGGETRAERESA